MADTMIHPDEPEDAGQVSLLSVKRHHLSNTFTDLSFIFSTVELKDNTIIVVLGASGDLAKKKTVRTPLPSRKQKTKQKTHTTSADLINAVPSSVRFGL